MTDKWGLGRALSARYDERSQILYELNKPILTQEVVRRTKNSKTTVTWTLSKLELILLLMVGYAAIHDFPIASKFMELLGIKDDGSPNTTDPSVSLAGGGGSLVDVLPAMGLAGATGTSADPIIRALTQILLATQSSGYVAGKNESGATSGDSSGGIGADDIAAALIKVKDLLPGVI